MATWVLMMMTMLAPGLALAASGLTITPTTWDVIGLDSNRPASGPKYFPVGVNVCKANGEPTGDVTVNFVWDSVDATYIKIRAGTLSSLVIPQMTAGTCADSRFEVEITQVAAAYGKNRPYHITATNNLNAQSVSTAVPRQLYIEYLISQNRNTVISYTIGGVAVTPGGSVNLQVGSTYDIVLNAATATQGYNQLESFLNLSNAAFELISISSIYSANNSPYVLTPNPRDYADACLWDANPASPNYLSCVGGILKLAERCGQLIGSRWWAVAVRYSLYLHWYMISPAVVSTITLTFPERGLISMWYLLPFQSHLRRHRQGGQRR